MIQEFLRTNSLKYFTLDLPVTEHALKSAFRSAARRLHPDVNPLGAEDFKRMMQTYEAIIKAGLVVQSDAQVDDGRKRTTSGDLLSDLGLGLGPTINSRDCDQCHGEGYTASEDLRFIKCDLCTGCCYVFQCRACFGTGQFTQRNQKKVPCNRCKATGSVPAPSIVDFWRLPPRGARGCPKCLATGRMGEGKKTFTYHTCGACNGKGEVKIYNPVILKGSLTQKQRKRA